MKKVILAIAATMMMTAAMAQDDNQPAKREGKKMDKTEMVKRRTDDAVKKYGLNEQQAKQLLDLNTKYADKMGRGPRGQRPGRDRKMGNADGEKQDKRPELTEEQRKEMEARHQEQEKAMKEYDTELQTIFTADQYSAYKADMEKRMKQGGPRGPRGDRQQQQQ